MNIVYSVLIMGILAFFCGDAVADGIYKWSDAQGHIHYTSDPPPKGARVHSVVLPALNSMPTLRHNTTQTAVVAQEKQADPVTLYGASWCGYCRAARQHLSQRGIPFTDVDIESDSGKAQYASIGGGKGIPVIVVGSGRMTGYGQEQLDNLLSAHGW